MRNMKDKMLNQIKKILLSVVMVLVLVGCFPTLAFATGNTTDTEDTITSDNQHSTVIDEPGTAETADDIADLNVSNQLTLTVGTDGELSSTMKILIFLTLISLAPTLIMMMTSFTRIIIVLHFTRSALNTQTSPPNRVLIGIALMLTIFIMSPVFNEINENALQPFNKGEITQEEFFEQAQQPLREFMEGETRTSDLNLFLEIAGIEETVTSNEDIPFIVLCCAFMLSELKTAFIIGFCIYVPFLIIDMVVASALMSMGMMMLPPTTVSLPFKILLFVLADGWTLVIANLVETFQYFGG